MQDKCGCRIGYHCAGRWYPHSRRTCKKGNPNKELNDIYDPRKHSVRMSLLQKRLQLL